MVLSRAILEHLEVVLVVVGDGAHQEREADNFGLVGPTLVLACLLQVAGLQAVLAHHFHHLGRWFWFKQNLFIYSK